MPFSFVTTQQVAEKFKEVEDRHVHSTPKTYLEFLKVSERSGGAAERGGGGVRKTNIRATTII